VKQYVLLLFIISPYLTFAANLEYQIDDVLITDEDIQITNKEYNEYSLQLQTNQAIELSLTSDNGNLVLAFLDNRFKFETEEIINKFYQNISIIELSFLFITLKNSGFYHFTAFEALDGRLIVFSQFPIRHQIHYKLGSSVALDQSGLDYPRLVIPAILFIATVFFWRIIGYKKIKKWDF
jgi:hypothetical protein